MKNLAAILVSLQILGAATAMLKSPVKRASQPDLQSEAEQVFALLLQDWTNFDMSQTRVQYVDPSGRKFDHIPVPGSTRQTDSGSAEPALKPGPVLNLSFELVDYVKDQIVEMMYQQFKDFHLPTEVSIPGLTMSQIHLQLRGLRPENVHLTLIEAENCLQVRLVRLDMNFLSAIKVEKFFITKTGSVDVHLRVNELIVRVALVDRPGKALRVPEVSCRLVSLDLDQDSLSIDLSLYMIPFFISDFIAYFIKWELPGQVLDFVTEFLPTQASAEVNTIIAENYPSTVALVPGQLAVSLLLTDAPRVRGNRLVISVDGFSFLESKGPVDRFVPSDIRFAADDTEGVVVGISQELLASVLEVFFAQINGNRFSVEAGPVKGSLRTNVTRDSLVISERGLRLADVAVEGRLQCAGYSVDADFTLNSGLSLDAFDFHRNIVEFSITQVELEPFSFRSNSAFIESFGPYVKALAEAFGRFFHNYRLPIPRVELPYNIHLDTAQFRNHPGYTVLKVDSHQEE